LELLNEIGLDIDNYFFACLLVTCCLLCKVAMIFNLHNSQQAHTVLKDLWPKIKETLQAGKQLRLEVKKATRSTDQNDMFHALIDKVYKAMKGAGSEWLADDWKRLLIDQWANETGRKIGKIAPSLDGQRVVQLGLQSHKFTKEEGSEFIEWLLCWMAEKGIET
jgi:cell division protein FtsL